jgi:hypothetical protein
MVVIHHPGTLTIPSHHYAPIFFTVLPSSIWIYLSISPEHPVRRATARADRDVGLRANPDGGRLPGPGPRVGSAEGPLCGFSSRGCCSRWCCCWCICRPSCWCRSRERGPCGSCPSTSRLQLPRTIRRRVPSGTSSFARLRPEISGDRSTVIARCAVSNRSYAVQNAHLVPKEEEKEPLRGYTRNSIGVLEGAEDMTTISQFDK